MKTTPTCDQLNRISAEILEYLDGKIIGGFGEHLGIKTRAGGEYWRPATNHAQGLKYFCKKFYDENWRVEIDPLSCIVVVTKGDKKILGLGAWVKDDRDKKIAYAFALAFVRTFADRSQGYQDFLKEGK